ncbi:MAG: hypothetical protein WCC82_11795 [Nitrososphaeraceae archaeon]|jgi:hypothetical protein
MKPISKSLSSFIPQNFGIGMDAAGDFDDIRGEIFNLNGLGKPPAA